MLKIYYAAMLLWTMLWCEDFAPGIDVVKYSCLGVFSDNHVLYDIMDLFNGSISCCFSTVVQTGLK